MVQNRQGFFSSRNFLLYTGIIVAVIGVVSAVYFWQYYSVSIETDLLQSLPDLTSNFVNREEEIKKLVTQLQYTQSEPRIISITGSPGFGKSTLAICVGHEVENYVNVFYIDMNEITGMHELAERVISVSNRTVSGKKYTLQDLQQWSRSLNKKTLLIMDNCDQLLHTTKDDLQKTTKNLIKYSSYRSLKIITTSRHQVMYLGQHQLRISELSASHSCEVLLNITGGSLDPTVCNSIANLTGGVPLALRVVGELLNMVDSSKPQDIVVQLEQNLIGTLSPNELHTEDRVNVSIYLSYQYLDNDRQRMGRYLSYFPGSFDKDAAHGVLKHILPEKNNVHDNLHLLVRRSLLDYSAQTDRYVFHKLIREYFRNVSSAEEIEDVKMHFVDYYTKFIDNLAQETFKQAVRSFYNEKQNFKHLFNESIGKIVSNRTCYRFKTLANTLSQHSQILNYGFTALELQRQIKNVLSLLKHSRWKFIRYFGKHLFVQDYSKLVMLLIETESPLFIKDTNFLIKSIEEHKQLFEKHGEHISTQNFIKYFSTLASYYEKIGKINKAEVCLVKALQRERALGVCQTECGNLELAKAFSYVKDYARSNKYCDKELNSISNNLPSLSFEDLLKAAKTLAELYKIYEDNNEYHRVDEVATKLADITIKHIIVADPYLLVGHLNSIIRIIGILQAQNHSAELELLKNHIKLGILSSQGYHSLINTTLFNLYYVDMNYEMVVLVGESFFFSVADNDNLQQFLPLTSYLVGEALYKLRRYYYSLSFYQAVVEYSDVMDHKMYHSCSQLRMTSFKCIYSSHQLVWFNIKSVWSSIGNFIFFSSSFQNSSISHTSYFNDFLSTDLATVSATALTLHNIGNMHKPTTESTIFDNMLSYSVLYILLVICRLIMLLFLLYFHKFYLQKIYFCFSYFSEVSFCKAPFQSLFVAFMWFYFTLLWSQLQNDIYYVMHSNSIDYLSLPVLMPVIVSNYILKF